MRVEHFICSLAQTSPPHLGMQFAPIDLRVHFTVLPIYHEEHGVKVQLTKRSGRITKGSPRQRVGRMLVRRNTIVAEPLVIFAALLQKLI